METYKAHETAVIDPGCNEYIHTRPVKEWAGKVPDLSKKPTIFLIYK